MNLGELKQGVQAVWGLLYPNLCQVCAEQRAEPSEGYVCHLCQRSVTPVVPPYCLVCGLPVQGEVTHSFTCTNCRDQPWDFDSARGAVAADGAVREAIHRYKYQRALWFEPFLSGLLVTHALPELRAQSWDAVVPVPLYPVKEREREFNQAERLGGHLARALDVPLELGLVKRVEPTEAQAKLTRKERLANIRRAFAPAEGVKINGKRVVVVDDVLTTGATTSAVSGVLKRMGAATVVVWAVARAIS